jgi:hypothetical protein
MQKGFGTKDNSGTPRAGNHSSWPANELTSLMESALAKNPNFFGTISVQVQFKQGRITLVRPILEQTLESESTPAAH